MWVTNPACSPHPVPAREPSRPWSPPKNDSVFKNQAPSLRKSPRRELNLAGGKMACCRLCHLLVSVFSCRKPGGRLGCQPDCIPLGPQHAQAGCEAPWACWSVITTDRLTPSVLFLERGPRCLPLTPDLLRQTRKDHRQGRPPCLCKSQSSVSGALGFQTLGPHLVSAEKGH